jgi:hypothetical protein
MELWQILVGGGLLIGIASLVTAFATRSRDKNSDTKDRFEATSEMAKYMRDEIEKEVERQVAPLKRDLKTALDESHEMNNVVRSREVQLWMWDQSGRIGLLPMLPAAILIRLGLENLVPKVPPTTT